MTHLSISSRSIGMFDSGVGGLTVMKQLLYTLPEEHIIYYGDTARIPYGNKSKDTIVRYSIENAIFLMDQSIKILVVACNTASAHSLQKLQQIFNIPVIGVIEPGAEAAVKASKNGRIAVLGTRGTIQSGAYQSEIHKLLPNAEVISIACPLFVPIVEENFLSHEAAKILVSEYLAPLKHSQIDTILLGCTHYPLLYPLIEEYIGPGVTIVDSAKSCADKVSTILTNHSLHAKSQNLEAHKYFVSDDPEKFRILGKEFLGMPLSHVSLMRIN